jgi:hypothetical protein
VLSGTQNQTDFTINLDRVANKSTVSPSTVQLLKAGVNQGHSATCNSPCTVITVNPDSALGEGRYTLTLNGVKSADEGLTFGASAAYAVPYVQSGSVGPSASGPSCLTQPPPVTSAPYPVSAADAGTQAFVEFDITLNGGSWTMTAKLDGTDVGHLDGAAAGHYRLEFPSSSGGNLTFELQGHCSSGSSSVSAANLFGSRIP